MEATAGCTVSTTSVMEGREYDTVGEGFVVSVGVDVAAPLAAAVEHPATASTDTRSTVKMKVFAPVNPLPFTTDNYIIVHGKEKVKKYRPFQQEAVRFEN